jgi:hypothetical protein
VWAAPARKPIPVRGDEIVHEQRARPLVQQPQPAAIAQQDAPPSEQVEAPVLTLVPLEPEPSRRVREPLGRVREPLVIHAALEVREVAWHPIQARQGQRVPATIRAGPTPRPIPVLAHVLAQVLAEHGRPQEEGSDGPADHACQLVHDQPVLQFVLERPRVDSSLA